jgi:integrase
MRLTGELVSRLKIDNGKNEQVIWDTEQRGFAVRMRRSAPDKPEHKSYVLYYKVGKKLNRWRIDDVSKITLKEARQRIKTRGLDPVAVKRAERSAQTIGDLIKAYLEATKDELRTRSYAENERHLNVVLKDLHGLSVDKIERKDIASCLRAVSKRREGGTRKHGGPVAANRARAALSAMFRWSIGEGKYKHDNPVAGTNKQKENDPRERSLSDEEAATLWNALPDDSYGRVVKLILLTGCRRGEIGGLQWSEIDTEARTITIPGSRTKNGREHVVPLSDMALAIVEGLPRFEHRQAVFGRGQGGFGNWSKTKIALDKAANLKTPWTLHDLRRTVRTGMGMLGVQPHIAEAVLNHLPPKLVRTYDRNTYLAEKKAALDLWTSHLNVAIARANGENVTPLRKA